MMGAGAVIFDSARGGDLGWIGQVWVKGHGC